MSYDYDLDIPARYAGDLRAKINKADIDVLVVENYGKLVIATTVDRANAQESLPGNLMRDRSLRGVRPHIFRSNVQGAMRHLKICLRQGRGKNRFSATSGVADRFRPLVMVPLLRLVCRSRGKDVSRVLDFQSVMRLRPSATILLLLGPESQLRRGLIIVFLRTSLGSCYSSPSWSSFYPCRLCCLCQYYQTDQPLVALLCLLP